MNCYTHAEAAAVGICKHCLRGVCADCATMVEGAVSCPGECEARVGMIQRVSANNPAVFEAANRQIRQQGVALVALSVIFLGMGGWGTLQGEDAYTFLFFTAGAVFLTLGVLRLRAKSQYPSPPPAKKP